MMLLRAHTFAPKPAVLIQAPFGRVEIPVSPINVSICVMLEGALLMESSIGLIRKIRTFKPL